MIFDFVSNLTTQYNTKLTELADKHAPVTSKTITERPEVEWYTIELKQEKRLKRKLETLQTHTPLRMLRALNCSATYTVTCF